ncbi:hypothetical protein [Teichococcus aestuarii]|uniref:hypothetical protein n=1 Tax=Teichococcus aestuarii TaxID=568898 RepID=UPI003609686B
MSINTTTFNFRLTEATIQRNGGVVTVWGPEGEPVRAAAGGRYVFTDGTVDDADGDLLVEDLLYYSRNHDVWLSGADADTHYASQGWQEGRATGGLFDAQAYLAANPDVAASGIDPLTHYRVFGWREGATPPLLRHRRLSRRQPRCRRRRHRPAGALHRLRPLRGALRHAGRAGGAGLRRGVLPGAEPRRRPLRHEPAGALRAVRPRRGPCRQRGVRPRPLPAQNPDVAASGMDPLEHYLRFGWREQRSPRPGSTAASIWPTTWTWPRPA